MFCLMVLCDLMSVDMVSADDMTDLNSLMDAAENEQIDVSQITKNKTAEKIAKQTAEIFNSSEYQKKLQTKINTLRAQLNPVDEGPPPISWKEEGQNTFLMPDEKIYLFISSSMPKITLRNYAQDLDKLRDKNIIIVMRGFLGGVKFIKPTLEFIESIHKKSPSCDPINSPCDAYNANIYIDPQAFARYGITNVPAFVYTRKENETDLSDAYQVSGDVSFEYALEIIEKESKSSQISNVLKKLRKGFY
jgi:type-F conjugative transfer system pilin assembly protein TrbC